MKTRAFDVRCPQCGKKLFTLQHDKPLEERIETICPRCPKVKGKARRVSVTLPHPLTGSGYTPLVEVA